MKYIDNIEFAKKEQKIDDEINVALLSRANELFENLSGQLHYTIIGSVDKKNKPVLIIGICGKITTSCQNCLEKLTLDINHNNILPIFYTEDDMDKALFGDEATYTDGILKDANFGIENFIEDELIMLLPIAPRHDRCSNITHHDKPNSPFSVLKNNKQFTH
jgi:uncharacterized protein